MFLHLIADRNKRLFLSLTKALCHADGHFTDDERAMVEQYCKELEIASDSADAVSDPKELIRSYLDMQDRVNALILG